jgi:hypothetical protein
MRTGCFREEKNMKRIPLIPVLLVVLTMLCASALAPTTAWAGDQDGKLHRPDVPRPADDLILDPYGSPDDDADGDPDTAGDGFGYTADKNPLGGGQLLECPGERIRVQIVLFLMDHVVIVR